jgi:hypothetical protein
VKVARGSKARSTRVLSATAWAREDCFEATLEG